MNLKALKECLSPATCLTRGLDLNHRVPEDESEQFYFNFKKNVGQREILLSGDVLG